MEKQIKVNEVIFEKISFRYDMYDIGRVYTGRAVNSLLLDTFYPYVLAREIVYPATGVLKLTNGRSGYAISEKIAQDLGVNHLHISELVTMLGYTKTDIAKLLQAVKNKNYNIALVGIGGTGSNFLHWLSQMSEWTGKTKIFPTLYAYDDDDFDIPNMLRIPFLPEFRGPNSTAKKVDCLPGRFKELAGRLMVVDERLDEDRLSSTYIGSNTRTIIYGAPDIATRSMLSASLYTFIAATHRDSEFSLVENPAVDDELMMETYGKINLSKFFLNHLTMTLKFLEHIRDRDIGLGTTIEESTILRANFDEMYSDKLQTGFKAGAKKVFIHSGTQQELELGGL